MVILMVGLLGVLCVDSASVFGLSVGSMVAHKLAFICHERVWAFVLAETSCGIHSTWYEGLLTDLTNPFVKYLSVKRQADLGAKVLRENTPAVHD